MDYLGGLRGTGLLLCGNASVAAVQYDFDGYISNSGQVTSCGEIRLQASALREVFGLADLHLQTAEGRRSASDSQKSVCRRAMAPRMSM